MALPESQEGPHKGFSILAKGCRPSHRQSGTHEVVFVGPKGFPSLIGSKFSYPLMNDLATSVYTTEGGRL
jgi:hypothetical protein